MKRFLRVLVLLLLFSGLELAVPASVFARTAFISSFDQSPVNVITQAEFARAQNFATRSGRESGVVQFGRRTFNVDESLQVIRPRVTIAGRGRSSTVLRLRAGNRVRGFLLTTNQTRTRIQNITLTGDNHVLLPDTFGGEPINGLSDEEGLRVTRGAEAMVRVDRGGFNFQAVGCAFRRCNVGIEYAPGVPPSGLLVRNCNFFTLRNMINARDNIFSDGTRNFTPNLARPMMIDNANLLTESGQNDVPGRGITMDFGNASAGQTGVRAPVNMRNSVIRNCNIARVSHFSIDMNRVSNVTIEDNELEGGGAGLRQLFVHCLHFEDECSDILVRRNRLTQRARNDANELVRLRSHIWLGGNNGSPEITLASNNQFFGNIDLTRIRIIEGSVIRR